MALGVKGREGLWSEPGAGGWGITQLGKFNDLFDRDKAVPIQ